MDPILIRERYKVIRVLEARETYIFAEALDILDRERRRCFLNVYTGAGLKAYLPCFESLRSCPDFLRMFMEDGSLVAVFKACRGTPVDQVFCRGKSYDWKTRLEYAELLLQEALKLADAMPEVSCAAMLSENVLIDMDNRRVKLRFKITPMEGMNERELVRLTAERLNKILPPDSEAAISQLGFLESASNGSCLNVVRLYGLWRERKDKIREEYEQLEKKNFILRKLGLLTGRVRLKAKQDRGE